MSGTIVKRQHYVWRRYLRAWSTESGKIFVFFKSTGRTVISNLMNVGQMKYFYKMEILNEDEMKFCYDFIMSSKNEEVIEYGLHILNCYEQFANLVKLRNEVPNVQQKSPDIDDGIRDIELNTFEELEGKFEGFGDTLLNCKSEGDLLTLIKDEPYECLFYIVVQYFRTRNMRDNLVNGMSERPKIKEITMKIMPLISIFMSMLFIFNTEKRKDYSFTFYTNNTSNEFITSEQPVINILDNDIDEDGFTKDLCFYYPITPKHAILVEFGKSQDRVKSMDVTEEEVLYFNKLMWSHSNEQVYASSSEFLKIL